MNARAIAYARGSSWEAGVMAEEGGQAYEWLKCCTEKVVMSKRTSTMA
jgi:hypothetical protein